VRRGPLIVLLLGVLAGSAAAQGSTTTTLASEPLVEKTDVKGTLPPGLAGRWLVVATARLPSGDVRTFNRLIEIRQGAEHLDLGAHRVELPHGFDERLTAANRDKQPWTPTPEDLAAVRTGWDTFPAIPQDLAAVENLLYAADGYPPEFQRDEVTRDSKVAIALREQFTGSRHVIGTYTIFAVRAIEPELLKGDFVTTTIAAAPMPIPITLKGDFVAYRLTGAGGGAERSWWQRVVDLFSGCGR